MRIVLALCLLLAQPVSAAPQSYNLPEETADFAAGPNLDIVQRYCDACHSADYVSTQPRPLKDPHAFWQAEVTKMQKAYGASINEADISKIVDYLSQAYGN